MFDSFRMPARAMGVAAVVSALSVPAFAGPVLLVNGSSGTSEPSTTSSITTQLTNLHVAAGNTVTVEDMVPADLSPYEEVWDIRFSDSLAISAAEESQFLNYLQDGNGLFVMGENSNFMARNNSVLSLIEAAGGGDLDFEVPVDPQSVVPPFDVPNPVASVDFVAPGGVDGAGSGQFITENGGEGTGLAFGVGDLSNAPAGALTTIFDVNFMETTASQAQQDLTANLIGFVDDQVNPDPEPDPDPVPGPAPLSMLGLGVAAFAVARRRPRR